MNRKRLRKTPNRIVSECCPKGPLHRTARVFDGGLYCYYCRDMVAPCL